VYEKLLRLLPGGKRQALSPERVSEPFSGLNPLHYNPYTEVGDERRLPNFVIREWRFRTGNEGMCN